MPEFPERHSAMSFAIALATLWLALVGCRANPKAYDMRAKIHIDKPEVFSRERLLIERSEELTWLEEQLDKADGVAFGYQGMRDVRQFEALYTQVNAKFDPLGGALTESQSQTALEQAGQLRELNRLSSQVSVLEYEQRIKALQAALEAAGDDPPDPQEPAAAQPAGVTKEELKAQLEAQLAEVDKRIADAKLGTVGPETASRFEESDTKKLAGVPDFQSFKTTDATLHPIDQFRDRLAYRHAIRAAMREQRLDDSHDLYGSTVYSLKFDITMATADEPPEDSWRPWRRAYMARVAMRIVPPVTNHATLYQRWIETLQRELNIEARALANQLRNNTHSRDERTAALYELKLAQPDTRAKLFKMLGDGEDREVTSPKAFIQWDAALQQPAYARPEPAADFDPEKAAHEIVAHRYARWLEDYVTQIEIDSLGSGVNKRYLIRVTGDENISDGGEELNSKRAEYAELYADVAQWYTAFDHLYKPGAAKADTKRWKGHADEQAKQLANRFREQTDPNHDEKLISRLRKICPEALAKACNAARGDAPSISKLRWAMKAHIDADPFMKFVADLERTQDQRNPPHGYVVQPKEQAQNISDVQALARLRNHVLSLQAVLPGYGVAGGAYVESLERSEARLQTILRQPLVVGFANSDSHYQQSYPRNSDDHFGWYLGPRFRLNQPNPKKPHKDGGVSFSYTHKPYSVTAAVVVPGWWDNFQIVTHAQWVGKRSGADLPKDEPYEHYIRKGVRPDYTTITDALLEFEGRYARRPYVYEPEVRDGDQRPFVLEVGARTQSILLRGPRLWRDADVYLGAQKADVVEILPDMNGLRVTFNAVLAPAAPDAQTSDLTIVTPTGTVTLRDAVRLVRPAKPPADQLGQFLSVHRRPLLEGQPILLHADPDVLPSGWSDIKLQVSWTDKAGVKKGPVVFDMPAGSIPAGLREGGLFDWKADPPTAGSTWGGASVRMVVDVRLKRRPSDSGDYRLWPSALVGGPTQLVYLTDSARKFKPELRGAPAIKVVSGKFDLNPRFTTVEQNALNVLLDGLPALKVALAADALDKRPYLRINSSGHVTKVPLRLTDSGNQLEAAFDGIAETDIRKLIPPSDDARSAPPRTIAAADMKIVYGEGDELAVSGDIKLTRP